MSDNPSQIERQKVFNYCRNMLGDGMVDVELDPDHYETALSRTINRYRQKSPNAVEESYVFLKLIKDTNDYILPEEVINVQSVSRRSLGSRTGGESGANLDPFNLAYTNTYLLNATMLGGISTYYLFASYQEMIGKVFGSYVEFQWIPYKHLFRILQRPFADGETIMLKCQNYRPDYSIINDIYAKQWVLDYTLANCKLILGEARSKFASLAGPAGGTTLNGADLKQTAATEIDKLDKELDLLVAGGTGYGFIIG